MVKYYPYLLRATYFLGDLAFLNTSFIVAYSIKFDKFSFYNDAPYVWLLLLFNLAWILVSVIFDNYNVSRLEGYTSVTLKMLKSILLHFFLITTLFVFVKTTYFSRAYLAYTYIIFTILVVFWRRFVIQSLRIYRKYGYNQKSYIIIGYSNLGNDLVNYLGNHPEFGYLFKGFFDDKFQSPQVKGNVKEVEQFSLEQQIDEIFCSVSHLSKTYIQQLQRFADANLVRLKMLPDLRKIADYPLHIERFGEIPVILTRREPLNNSLNRFVKRSFDILFSSLVLVLIFSWLVPLIGLIIKIDSPGPVFFLQKRSGRNGKRFVCYKFRTMKYRKEAGFQQATRNDPRVTRVGKFLRKSNLDELPQFINVFLGNMTVVGPRPHPIPLDDKFKTLIEKYMVRHFVKPGVTGLAQVKGYRGETKDVRQMINRVRMDVFYIENWSFLLDLKIIFLTVFSMLRGDKNAF